MSETSESPSAPASLTPPQPVAAMSTAATPARRIAARRTQFPPLVDNLYMNCRFYRQCRSRYVPRRGLVKREGAPMWVSRRTDYASRAVLALALTDGGPLKLDQLAEQTEAPRSVLEQV